MSLHLGAGRDHFGDAGGRSRVEVADQEVDVEARGDGVLDTGIGGDDERADGHAVERVGRWWISAGEDDGGEARGRQLG
jgi:hypothetical protein